jgi:hypothetical protein
MNRFKKIELLLKIAVNKENQKLRDDFMEKFSEENPGKAAAIADQWYLSFRGTEIFDTWNFLGNLNEIIKFIKENKDSVNTSVVKQENANLMMLSELYPNKVDVFEKFDDRFLSWIASRFGSNPTVKEIHPHNDSLPTLLYYSSNLDKISQRFKSSEEYRRLFKDRVSSSASPTDIKQLNIDQMEKAANLANRSPDCFIDIEEDYSPRKFIGQFGSWKLWIPQTTKDSIAISGVDLNSMEPETDWCTARTSGQNLFTTYADQNKILFYAIKDGADEPDDYQSIGWKMNDGVNLYRRETLDYGFLYDGDGTETVNGDNVGRYKGNHNSLFGAEVENIYEAMKDEVIAIRGVHPVESLFERAAFGDAEARAALLSGAIPGDQYDSIVERIEDTNYSLVRDKPDTAAKVMSESEDINVARAYVEANFHTKKKYLEYTRKVAKVLAKECDLDNVFDCDYIEYELHLINALKDISLPLLERLAEKNLWHNVSMYFMQKTYSKQSYEERKSYIPLAKKFAESLVTGDNPDDFTDFFASNFHLLDETKDIGAKYIKEYAERGDYPEDWFISKYDIEPMLMEIKDIWAENFLLNVESGKYVDVRERDIKLAKDILAETEQEKEDLREIISQLKDYREDLEAAGIRLEKIEYNGLKDMQKLIISIAKQLANDGSIIFYDLDFTDIDITEGFSASWAENFINQVNQKSELSRNERLAKMLAEEILSEQNFSENKLAQLTDWLNGMGLKKEANKTLLLKRFKYE